MSSSSFSGFLLLLVLHPLPDYRLEALGYHPGPLLAHVVADVWDPPLRVRAAPAEHRLCAYVVLYHDEREERGKVYLAYVLVEPHLRLVDETAPVPLQQCLGRLWYLRSARLPGDQQAVLEGHVTLQAAQALAYGRTAALVQGDAAEAGHFEEPVQPALRKDEVVLRVEVDAPIELVRGRGVEHPTISHVGGPPLGERSSSGPGPCSG